MSVYDDGRVEITEDSLKIYWYYFPGAGSKTIHFSAIKKVERVQPGVGSVKGWGMSLTPVWWACDLSRGLSNVRFLMIAFRAARDVWRAAAPVLIRRRCPHCQKNPCMVVYTMNQPWVFNPGCGFTPKDFETVNRLIGEGMARYNNLSESKKQ